MPEKSKYKSVAFSLDVEEFPLLFLSATDPQTYKAKSSYSATAGLTPGSPQLAALEAALIKTAKEAYGEGVDVKTLKFPLVSGTAKADKQKKKGEGNSYERTRGFVLFKASSPTQYPPSLIFNSNGTMVAVNDGNRAVAKKHFYAGVFGHLEVALLAYDGNDNVDPADGPIIIPGVTAYLRTVISNSHGENLGSGPDVNKWQNTAKRLGTVSDVDPTAAKAEGGLSY